MGSLAHALSFPLGGDLVVGVGPAGAATFVLSLEDGAKITYSWRTEVQKMRDGSERRICSRSCPLMTFDCSAFLISADDRDIRSQLIASASSGAAFLLGLSFEEATLTADASGGDVTVHDMAVLDWAIAGQRVICVGPDDSVAEGVIQAVTSTTITLDTSPGTAGARGGRIMPAHAIYLDPQQGFGRLPITVEHWQIKARAAVFGFADSDDMGAGATLTTFDGLNVYDRGLQVEGTAMDSMQSMAEVVDLGGVLTSSGAALVPDWGREVRIESSDAATWQWFKKFVSMVRGKQVAWLLPTWRPDFVFLSKTSTTTIKIASGSVTGAGDITKWFGVSTAHLYLQILQTNGTLVYAKISSVTDNLDGTVTVIMTTAAVTGTPSVISWMELVHFDSDAIEVTWEAATFSVQTIAQVVQG